MKVQRPRFGRHFSSLHRLACMYVALAAVERNLMKRKNCSPPPANGTYLHLAPNPFRLLAAYINQSSIHNFHFILGLFRLRSRHPGSYRYRLMARFPIPKDPVLCIDRTRENNFYCNEIASSTFMLVFALPDEEKKIFPPPPHVPPVSGLES
ncbi:hypothetical protein P280DRAFT_231406 [Massarina eburnea CBS 473.64]|uniref:Uncharacterized protein n=1 Tax=Massarina eburnea CBS 473.64 TaxID=1395130 RepID=A0A6A6SCE2_9PLEO|nr:hypothetical protein P280DRAFT_231406 [Massarina eburnea CBS 473.64]